MALPLSNGTAQVLLCGEFTLSTSTKDRYSVRLTSTELQVQKTGQTRLLLQLLDCIGCRAFKGEDSSDAGAYFSAYFYPFKKRWMSSGAVRQRVVQTFRVEVSQDPLENLKEAEKWAQAIRDSSIQQLPKQEVAIPDWDQYTTLPCLKEEELQQDGDVYPSVLRIPQINQSLWRESTESITLRAWPSVPNRQYIRPNRKSSDL